MDTFFVCRGKKTFDPWNESPDKFLQQQYGSVYGSYRVRCPFCGSNYKHTREEYPDEIHKCEYCGFTHTSYDREGNGVSGTWRITKVELLTLLALDINDAQLGLDELGSHLRRRFDDVYELEPRRFEELVADIYRHLGYHTRITQQTRDGGYDIVLVEAASGKRVLVECKRYAHNRRIEVSTVRELLGVQLIEGVPDAKIVATTSFTAPAKETAQRVNETVRGYSLELVSANDLLKALDVYNVALPPLEIALRPKATR
jgi:hypothetical protein